MGTGEGGVKFMFKFLSSNLAVFGDLQKHLFGNFVLVLYIYYRDQVPNQGVIFTSIPADHTNSFNLTGNIFKK